MCKRKKYSNVRQQTKIAALRRDLGHRQFKVIYAIILLFYYN